MIATFGAVTIENIVAATPLILTIQIVRIAIQNGCSRSSTDDSHRLEPVGKVMHPHGDTEAFSAASGTD